MSRQCPACGSRSVSIVPFGLCGPGFHTGLGITVACGLACCGLMCTGNLVRERKPPEQRNDNRPSGVPVVIERRGRADPPDHWLPEAGPMPHIVHPPELGPKPHLASPIPFHQRREIYAELATFSDRAEEMAARKLGRRPKQGNDEFLQFRIQFQRETERALKALREELAQRNGLLVTELMATQEEGDREGWPASIRKK